MDKVVLETAAVQVMGEYTVSGSTNAALVGRWHLSQGCERDLERPLPLQRGSVSAGIHSESVKSEGVLS